MSTKILLMIAICGLPNFVCSGTFASTASDTLVLRKRERKAVEIVEVYPDQIRYKNLNDKKKQILSIATKEVAMAIYDNGTSDFFNPLHVINRYALVFGNDKYKHSTKLNGQPVNDAADIKERLVSMGFTVMISTDADRQKMLDDLDDFIIKAQHAEVIMLYYSGHGVQDDYENYLVPVDARFISKSDIANRGISVSGIISKLGSARAKFNIIAMDACRNSTVTIETSNTKDDIPKGFKPIKGDDLIGSVYISLASRAGKPAYVNTNGRNGYFTAALLKHMENGKRIESIFRAVSVEVGKMTEQKQQPEIIDRLNGDLEF